jgi:hypothetical protein
LNIAAIVDSKNERYPLTLHPLPHLRGEGEIRPSILRQAEDMLLLKRNGMGIKCWQNIFPFWKRGTIPTNRRNWSELIKSKEVP